VIVVRRADLEQQSRGLVALEERDPAVDAGTGKRCIIRDLSNPSIVIILTIDIRIFIE